ncbi:MAG: DUF389 domain-containing protein [Phocaeicola sp.]|nr:DUF389 domain-containing protein [Phocaeicola sp.]MDD7447952.1 DUF389 domain-containing protein [Prevotellaceae bacterium]MDY3914544.1 DUF389 domain-containing protein [Phocaeicola sp.]MDY5939938.1 DUF389 domain-containing protein [Phocaeicola sp.]
MEQKRFVLKDFFRDYFDLQNNKEDESDIIESIRAGIEIKGTNLWVLIFAILIASLGLNTNSTAVIIGAMLISPLMGPIMGIGLSIGRNDLGMLKKSFKSYAVTTLFSITTATLYFFFTPLDEVQSELLARTSPTIYDVLIALVGGLAGIIALGTKNKGNVIPGVAIATALMPPLCTAGFGIATGNLLYFLGAFYLYFINSVFISLATFLGVRILGFRRKEILDPARAQLVHRYVWIITLLTMAPAVWLTYGIVKETIYKSQVNDFINKELHFDGTQVLSRTINYSKKEVSVVLVGEEVTQTDLDKARARMEDYSLTQSKLTIYQGTNNAGAAVDANSIRSMVLQDFYKNSEEHIAKQQKQIDSLQQVLNHTGGAYATDQKLREELKVLFPEVKNIALGKSLSVNVDSNSIDTFVYALVHTQPVYSPAQVTKLQQWLSARIGEKKVRVIKE